MLWIYVNSTGAIECSVNVGYKVRQGDAFDVFIVLWGMNGEATPNNIGGALYTLSYVKYINPQMNSFSSAYVGAIESANEEFIVGNPSQVNSKFVSGVAYNGYKVRIPEQATTFSSNGGNVGLEIGLLSNGESQYVHAQTANVFVEGTYANKPDLITTSDYAMMLDLIREANFVLTFPLTLVSENGVSAITGDPNQPTIVLSKTFAYVGGKCKVDRSLLNDALEAVAGTEDDGYATIAYFDSANVSLRYEAQIFGIDQYGNTVQLRVQGAKGTINRINVDLFIEDPIASSFIDEITFFGTCPVDATYLDFSSGEEGEGKLITDISASANTLPAGSSATVTASVVPLGDGVSAYLQFVFGIPKGDKGDQGDKGDTGDSAGFGTPTASASGLPAGSAPTVSVSVDSESPDTAKVFQFNFGIPKGDTGATGAQGPRGETSLSADGIFALYVDSDTGQLMAQYEEGSTDPSTYLSIDQNTGDLMYTYQE